MLRLCFLITSKHIFMGPGGFSKFPSLILESIRFSDPVVIVYMAIYCIEISQLYLYSNSYNYIKSTPLQKFPETEFKQFS